MANPSSAPPSFLARLRQRLPKLHPHLPLMVSRLGRKAAAINLCVVAGVIILFFWTDNSREQLIESRLKAMRIEGELIARSFAGETVVGPQSTEISPDDANRMMGMMVTPTDVRARFYNKKGRLISDSKLLGSGQVEEFDLPPIGEENRIKLEERLYDWWHRLFVEKDLPPYQEYANQPGTDFEEVVKALNGEVGEMRRQSSDGELIVTVAVPVQRFKIVFGVLLISDKGGDIELQVREQATERLRLLVMVLLLSLAISFINSFFIVRPIRKLAEAADEAVTGTNFTRVEMPAVNRRDEIGALATSFRRMVRALYLRMEAIESFAADVAHEIKNPLTSIRSAVETLEFVKDEAAKEKLLQLIKQDVGRLDRLISDISDASRLDAELVRETSEPVDMVSFLEGLHQIYESTRNEDDPRVVLEIERDRPGQRFTVFGLEGRYGQVFRNVVNNAMSFSKPGDEIRVVMRRGHLNGEDVVEVAVEDSGPGIPPDNLESIFNRFYTERPESEGFGTNSGLGLSISRQIVEMFDGRIWAENRMSEDGETVLGARFVVALPLRLRDSDGTSDR